MFQDKRFIGIKHTSADLFTLQQFKEKIDGVTVFNGFDEMCLGGLAMGADGAIGSTYNFMADKFLKIFYVSAFESYNIFLGNIYAVFSCPLA